MKKMKKIRNGAAVLLSLIVCASANAYDRCENISKGLAGSYSVALLAKDGTRSQVGNVKFTKTKDALTFKAKNLVVIGDVLLPGAPKKIKLKAEGDECLFVGIGIIESNTLGQIVEGEDMKFFSVQVEDESFDSVAFSKL